MGKTTIARELACSLAAVYLRIDSIEQALRQAGLAVEGEGYAVAHVVAADNLRAGQTVVADCVNPSATRRSGNVSSNTFPASFRLVRTRSMRIRQVCARPAPGELDGPTV